MSDTVFVDTNVLIYTRDTAAEEKQPLAQEWLKRLWRSRAGRTSIQVLNEYYVNVTRKLSPGLTDEQARSDVRSLQAWQPIGLDGELLEQAWSVQDRFGFSLWDALIVAAARRAGCRYLLTEDLQDEQDLGGLQVVNPFTHPSESVLPTPDTDAS